MITNCLFQRETLILYRITSYNVCYTKLLRHVIMKAYNICLRLKTPSTEGKLLSFIDKTKDILESAEIFNKKFSGWSKTILITGIQKDRINLLLILEKEKHNISTREIRSFTAYLYHEKMWNIYSRETAKLFEGIIFKEVDKKDLVATLYELKNGKLTIMNSDTLDNLINVVNSDDKTVLKP